MAKLKHAGRAAKDKLMVPMRAIAGKGEGMSWGDCLRVLEGRGVDCGALRIWATAADKDEIDWIYKRVADARPKRR